jgi:sigma54-dependent transcription regulator
MKNSACQKMTVVVCGFLGLGLGSMLIATAAWVYWRPYDNLCGMCSEAIVHRVELMGRWCVW